MVGIVALQCTVYQRGCLRAPETETCLGTLGRRLIAPAMTLNCSGRARFHAIVPYAHFVRVEITCAFSFGPLSAPIIWRLSHSSLICPHPRVPRSRHDRTDDTSGHRGSVDAPIR